MKKFTFIVLFLLCNFFAFSQPTTITYQGKLLDNSNKPINESAVAFTFAIFDAETGGNKIWPPNNAASTKSIDIVNGLYSVILGTGSGNDESIEPSIFNGITPYLEVGVNSTTLPRTSITSVPFSLLSNNLTANGWASPSAIGSTTPNSGTFTELTVGTTNSYAFPSEDGADGQVLVTDGTGNLSWETPASGGSGIPVPSGAVANDLLSFDGTNWIARNIVIQNTGSGQSVNNMQPYLAVYYSIALYGIFPSRNNTEPFIGAISIHGFNFAPRNWAFCEGQLLSIAQNTALFSLLGTTYGGNGQTTFALPDLRGRVPIGPGQGPGLTNRSWGEVGGTETITITVGQLPAHSHTVIYE
ncbi:MAG: tail fiber protein [Desulfobulbaceae bacterium]|nr:tail fiber protein [Desulfobulbaceae bacterium]